MCIMQVYCLRLDCVAAKLHGKKRFFYTVHDVCSMNVCSICKTVTLAMFDGTQGLYAGGTFQSV